MPHCGVGTPFNVSSEHYCNLPNTEQTTVCQVEPLKYVQVCRQGTAYRANTNGKQDRRLAKRSPAGAVVDEMMKDRGLEDGTISTAVY